MTTIAGNMKLIKTIQGSLKDNPYGPPFSQIGIYCPSIRELGKIIQNFGFAEYEATQWVFDTAIHYGMIFRGEHHWTPIQVKAHMAFNYDIWPGKEYELMFWEHIHRSPIQRHPFAHFTDPMFTTLTYRVECVHTEAARLRREFGLQPMYMLVSKKHTNPGIRNLSRYKDIMYDTLDELGYYYRIVCRIPHEPWTISPKFSGVECNPYYIGHWDSIDAWQAPDGQWIRNGWTQDGYHIPGYRGGAR